MDKLTKPILVILCIFLAIILFISTLSFNCQIKFLKNRNNFLILKNIELIQKEEIKKKYIIDETSFILNDKNFKRGWDSLELLTSICQLKSLCEFNQLNYDTIFTIIYLESRWDPKALSPKGAKGLFQLSAILCREKDWDYNKMHISSYNIQCGIIIWAELFEIYTREHAFLMYNYGNIKGDEYNNQYIKLFNKQYKQIIDRRKNYARSNTSL